LLMPFFDSILNGGLWSPSIVAADAEQKAIGPMTPTVSAQVNGIRTSPPAQAPTLSVRTAPDLINTIWL